MVPGIGLYPAGLQALELPSLETEERTSRQQQRHQWFIFQGILYKGSWNNTLPYTTDVGQDMAAAFTTWGEGGYHL